MMKTDLIAIVTILLIAAAVGLHKCFCVKSYLFLSYIGILFQGEVAYEPIFTPYAQRTRMF